MALAQAFNEWMRRFIEEPERHSREFQEVRSFLDDENAGVEPAYGRECAAYLQSIMDVVIEASPPS